MPYQVFGDNPGAVAVTVTCTRSASARSCGAISAILSRTACRPSAFLAPCLPSARSSAARSFIAARSSALKPPDSALAFFAGIRGLPFVTLRGSASCRPSVGRLDPATLWCFSIPDRIGGPAEALKWRPPSLTARPDLHCDRTSGGARNRGVRAVRMPARYGPHQLRYDLNRFTFLLGGSDGERLFGP